jgi:tRNA pseudouridine55 synthase
LIDKQVGGFIFVDKPLGISSFDVVRIIKKQLQPNKIGHGGTLDPLASGVLPIALNEGTKIIDYVFNANKTYEFILQFGYTTSTQDLEGEPIEYNDYFPSKDEIKRVIPRFIGNIMQKPPKYSAIKINGQRSYLRARNNEDFEVPARKINISNLSMLNYDQELRQVKFSAKVGKGTYIRSLAEDIARAASSAGHVIFLRRTQLMGVDVDPSLTLGNKKILLISEKQLYNVKEYLGEALVNIEDMLDDISAYLLNSSQTKDLFNGKLSSLNSGDTLKNGLLKAMYNGKLIALLEYQDGNFSFLRVFNTNRHLI